VNLLNFVIIKVVIYLVIGILVAHYFQIELDFSVTSVIIGLAFCGILIISNRNHSRLKHWAGISLLFTIFFTGILTYNFHNQQHFENHYIKLGFIEQDTIYDIQFRVREILKPGNFYDKYVVDILQINDRNVSGKTLLNIERDTVYTNLEVDDIIRTKTSLKSLISPLNPHQFNYKNYLNKNNIYHQVFSQRNDLFSVSRNKHTIFGFAFSLRQRINNKLRKYDFRPDELAIINALLLGQRQDISEDIYNSYTQAGAIHILAVSGLHVGIILILLQFLFKPLGQLRHGNYFTMFTIACLLWMYAIIAGLSASVVRAVTMFTIVAIGMNLKRPINIYNTLAISILILLLFKPTFLFDVGFQLSYLAVLAIVIIQPIISSWWKPSNRTLKFFWNILTVTIAAQFGVIPISLYYFHQFPGLFFISNLVIIPLLGTILGLGLLIIVLSLIDLLPDYLAKMYADIINYMNRFVTLVSSQEDFLFQDISFSAFQVIICYSIIGCILWFYKSKSHKAILTGLLTIIIFQGYVLGTKTYESQNKFIVFHKSRHTIIGEQREDQIVLNHNLQTIDSEKFVLNYKVGENLKIVENDSIKPLYRFQDLSMLVVDSLGLYKIESIKPQIILLRNSPKINLKRLIKKLKPQLIISDGSNYTSYQEQWESTCAKNNTPFHRTGKKGAYVYSY